MLTAEERKLSNMSDKFTISVHSGFTATYKLLVELDNKGYVDIENNEPEFGIIEKDEVDNFIYRTQRIRSDYNNISVTLRIKIFEG